MSTEQDITHNIQAINPSLEKLKQAFPHCFDKNGDFDFAKFKAELDSNDINIAKEGYSLDWLGKSYARVLASDAAITLLKEDEVHNAKPENVNSQNLLIKGDNLEVLKHLSNAYYEKVKMIYIDPPYNTGSDGFVYNDDRKFTAKQLQDLAGVSEDEAKRILEFTQSNSNSHSAWLTFMYPRLYIAKQLLKDDGVIFVSIDDNEVAQLRLLMDEVFGEENFICEFIWQKKTGASDAIGIATITEYILCYSLNKEKVDNTFTKNINSFDITRYKNTDEYVEERGMYYTDNLDRGGLNYSDSMNFGIECPDGTIAFPNGRKEYFNDGWIWKWGKDKIKWAIENNFLEFKKSATKECGWSVCYKNYMNVDNEGNEIERSAAHKNLLLNIINKKGTDELKKLFDKKVIFKNSKPVELIKSFLSFVNLKSDDIIIDFFGGSGTTAQAVLEFNTDTNINISFLLVQLPEIIDAKKSKVVYDFVKDELGVTSPTIFEITKERIIRAANQINTELDSKIEKLKNELPTEENKAEIAKNVALKTQNSFKIFETTPIWEDYDFKAAKLANAEKLFDDDKLTEADIKALFTTWKTYDGSPLTEPVQEVALAGYKTYYTKQKLYLMHKGFSTVTLKALLEQIDADANFNPTAIIAFGYYFESKALREIAENIKTYNNKKNIDIDFITRY